DVEFNPVISAGGMNGLYLRAGYLLTSGDTLFTEGLDVALIAAGGTVDDAQGITDAEGRFETMARLSDGSDSVLVTITVSGGAGSGRSDGGDSVLVTITVSGAAGERVVRTEKARLNSGPPFKGTYVGTVEIGRGAVQGCQLDTFDTFDAHVIVRVTWFAEEQR